MAEKKSARIQRLVNIQRQREKMAETELADILSLQQNTQDSMDSVVTALGTFDPIHMVLSGHYSRRLSKLDVKQKQLLIHREIKERNMLTERAKADRMEERVQSIKMDEAREAEDETLQDLIDALGGMKKSSFR